MELKELTDRTLELFEIEDIKQLGDVLLESCHKVERLRAFRDLVDGDLGTDWLQKIYQYHLADRKEKKQDYTPASLAQFMGMLAGNADRVIDMCAGSGALIIQKWNQNKNIEFTAIENDKSVIPFLLFNLVLRNIKSTVYLMDVLGDEDAAEVWKITRGEEFGNIVDLKPAI